MGEEIMERKRDGFFKSLLEPINPHLCVLAGVLNILVGAWDLIPATMGSSYTQSPLTGGIVSWTLIALGIALLLMHRQFNPKRLFVGMTINGIVWAAGAGIFMFENWQSSVWMLLTVISVYSIFVAANMKVNFIEE